MYPIPFNYFYQEISKRYENFGDLFNVLPEFIITGTLPTFRLHFSDVLLMTSVSNLNMEYAINCIYSMILADPYVSILVIDLGLSVKNLQLLVAHFQSIHQIQQKMKSNGFLAYRKIHWKNYPTWMNPSTGGKEQRGGYAWKMIAVSDAFFEWRGCLGWIDGSSVIIEGISREVTAAHHFGFYVPRSIGTISDWVHEGMQSFLLKHHFVKQLDPKGPNCMSGTFFADFSHAYVRQLMVQIRECSYTRKCLAPLNSSLANHRFDQALLSSLINNYNIPRVSDNHFRFHPALKNEGMDTLSVLKNLMLLIQSQYRIRFTNEYVDTNHLKLTNETFRYTSRPLDF